MPKAFLKRIQPLRQRWKMVEWPFPLEAAEGEERPKLKLRALSLAEFEAAHLSTMDHFKSRKPPIREEDSAYLARLNAELVFRAYSVDGETIAESVDDLADEPIGIIDELHRTRRQFQEDVTAAPMTPAQMDALIDHLKKNMDVGLLFELPSIWLTELAITLASRLPSSMPASERG